MASSSTLHASVAMAGALPTQGTTQAAPQLIVWQHLLSGAEIEVFDVSIRTLSGRTLVLYQDGKHKRVAM